MKKFLTATTAILISASTFAVMANHHEGDKKEHKGGMISEIDTNKDGAISKDEFVANAAKNFSQIDSDNNGKASEDEMKAFHKAQKAKHKAMKKEREAEQEKRFGEMDKDGDGKISKEEMMPKKHKSEGEEKEESEKDGSEE